MELRVLHDGRVIHSRRLGHRPLTIGRSSSNDLVLSSPDISGHHALVYREAGRVVLEDLDSSNGTFLNGEPVRRPVDLGVGDQIRLGRGTHLQTAAAPVLPRAPLLVERLDGGLSWPMHEASLTLPGSGDVQLLRDELGEVWLAVDGVEEETVSLGSTFEVDGVTYRLLQTDGLTAETEADRADPFAYRLTVSLPASTAQLAAPTGAPQCTYGADNHVALLFALGRQWAEDAPGPERGWMDDDALATAIWGRQRHQQLLNNLHVLVHRVRKKAVGTGLEGVFLQKRRGRARLRLASAEVG